MLSLKTKKLLAELFKLVGETECQLETMRTTLCSNSKFCFSTVFSRIARKDNQVLGSHIMAFLQENSISASLDYCNAFVEFLKLPGNYGLSSFELASVLSPKLQPELTERVQSREAHALESSQFLNFEIEYQVSRIIEYELSLMKTVT